MSLQFELCRCLTFRHNPTINIESQTSSFLYVAQACFVMMRSHPSLEFTRPTLTLVRLLIMRHEYSSLLLNAAHRPPLTLVEVDHQLGSRENQLQLPRHHTVSPRLAHRTPFSPLLLDTSAAHSNQYNSANDRHSNRFRTPKGMSAAVQLDAPFKQHRGL